MIIQQTLKPYEIFLQLTASQLQIELQFSHELQTFKGQLNNCSSGWLYSLVHSLYCPDFFNSTSVKNISCLFQ